MKKLFGNEYRVVLWHASDVDLDSVLINTMPDVPLQLDRTAGASILTVPVESRENFAIECQFSYL